MTNEVKLEIFREPHDSQGSGVHFLGNYSILKGKIHFEGQAMGQLRTLQRSKEHHENKQQNCKEVQRDRNITEFMSRGLERNYTHSFTDQQFLIVQITHVYK